MRDGGETLVRYHSTLSRLLGEVEKLLETNGEKQKDVAEIADRQRAPD